MTDYFDKPALSFSKLSGMLISAKECLHRMNDTSEPGDPFKLGGGFHCRVLEPASYKDRYTFYEKARNKNHSEYQEFLAGQPEGITVLKKSEFEDVEEMAKAIESSPATTGLLDDLRHRERELFWVQPDAKIDMKCRLDASGPVGIVELKSADDVDPRKFPNKAFRLGYAMQAAIYIEGLKANDPDASAEHYTIAVQKKPPYDVVVYRASDEWLALGYEQYEECLKKFVACMNSGIWPGICEDVIEIQPPHWARVESKTFLDFEDEL